MLSSYEYPRLKGEDTDHAGDTYRRWRCAQGGERRGHIINGRDVCRQVWHGRNGGNSIRHICALGIQLSVTDGVDSCVDGHEVDVINLVNGGGNLQASVVQR